MKLALITVLIGGLTHTYNVQGDIWGFLEDACKIYTKKPQVERVQVTKAEIFLLHLSRHLLRWDACRYTTDQRN
jgi:hypothetical protein